jgi:hypothetical protein
MTKFQTVFRLLLVSGSLVVAAQCGGGSSGGQNAGGEGGQDVDSGGHSGDGGAASGGSKAGSGGTVSSSGGNGGLAPSTGGMGAGGSLTGGASAGMGGTNAGGVGGVAGMAAGGMAGMSNTGGTKPAVTYKPAKFSTNFDGADAVAGQKPPMPFTAGSTAQIDTSNKYSGTKSVKLTCVGEGGGDQCMFSLPLKPEWLGAGKKTMYTRFMMNMSAYPSKEGRVHWDVVKVYGDFKSDDGKTSLYNGMISVGGFADAASKFMIFGTNQSGSPTEDCSKTSPKLLTPNQWHCVELQIDEQEILTYSVLLDSERLQTFTFPYTNAASNCATMPPYVADVFKGVWYVPVVNKLSFGFNSVTNGGVVKPPTIWIDDIAVSDSPIGCPAK